MRNEREVFLEERLKLMQSKMAEVFAASWNVPSEHGHEKNPVIRQ